MKNKKHINNSIKNPIKNATNHINNPMEYPDNLIKNTNENANKNLLTPSKHLLKTPSRPDSKPKKTRLKNLKALVKIRKPD